jgi:hypothetical protein
MHDIEQINNLNERIRAGRANGPSDIFTKCARILVKFTTSSLVLLTPIYRVTTAVGGCLIIFTIGFFALPISFVWLPFYYLLEGTSWLWLRAWYLRPILLFPGVIIAFIADLYVMLMPDFERGAKRTKRAICEEWPLSWYLIRPPKQSVV